MRRSVLGIIAFAYLNIGCGTDQDGYSPSTLQLSSIYYHRDTLIDYERPATDGLLAGQYDWVDPDLNPALVSAHRSGNEFVEFELIRFSRSMFTNEAFETLSGLGLRPATTFEVFAFGEIYPDEQRQHGITAIGDIEIHSDSQEHTPGFAPFLYGNDSGRYLILHWSFFRWNSNTHFLVVHDSLDDESAE